MTFRIIVEFEVEEEDMLEAMLGVQTMSKKRVISVQPAPKELETSSDAEPDVCSSCNHPLYRHVDGDDCQWIDVYCDFNECNCMCTSARDDTKDMTELPLSAFTPKEEPDTPPEETKFTPVGWPNKKEIDDEIDQEALISTG